MIRISLDPWMLQSVTHESTDLWVDELDESTAYFFKGTGGWGVTMTLDPMEVSLEAEFL